MHVSPCRPCKEKKAAAEGAGDQVSSSAAAPAAAEAVPATEAPAKTVEGPAAPAAVESPAASPAAPEPMGESKSAAPADSMLRLAVKRNFLQQMCLASIALVEPEH